MNPQPPPVLLNDFFTMHELQPSISSLSCMVVFNNYHEVFKGQISKKLEIPREFLIQIVQEILEREVNKKISGHSIQKVNYAKPIDISVNPEIFMNWKEIEQGFYVEAVFKKDADLFELTGTFEIV